MIIRVEPKSSTPIFQQIADGIKSAIARGVYAPGEMISSVRQMAAQALVNPNTVARAYRDLERGGVLTTRKGLGVFVSGNAPKICREDRRGTLSERLGEVVSEAERSGISPEELRAAFETAVRHEPQS